MTTPDGLTGRVLGGRYRLAERIGAGGMAEVRRAEDERLGRAVAVKLLDPVLAAQPDLRRRFEEEARAAARLSHPSVVAVYDTGEWEDRPYLVMELLDGRTLADEMRAGPLAVARVRQVALDVLSALAAAHAAGVLHRDVKPANLLIAAGGAVKIGDFGIAKADPISGERAPGETVALAPPTMAGQILGTPSYLAPERVNGHPATAATDVWAVGVVCWEALSGKRAYPSGQALQVAMAVAGTDLAPIIELRPETDPSLAHAVDVAVRRDPTRRWQSARAMHDAVVGAATPPEATWDGRDHTVALPAAWAAGGREEPPATRRRTWAAAPPPVRRRPIPGRPSRLGSIGLVALAALAAIVALVALAGGGSHHRSKGPAAAGSTTTFTTPTTPAPTTTTTSTTAPPTPPGPKGHGKKGG